MGRALESLKGTPHDRPDDRCDDRRGDRSVIGKPLGTQCTMPCLLLLIEIAIACQLYLTMLATLQKAAVLGGQAISLASTSPLQAAIIRALSQTSLPPKPQEPSPEDCCQV